VIESGALHEPFVVIDVGVQGGELARSSVEQGPLARKVRAAKPDHT
jgi:hypothetical protein